MTPRQFQAIRLRHENRTRHDELLFGIVASTIHNSSMGAKKSLKPEDFMPCMWGLTERDQKRKKLNKRSRKAIAQEVSIFFQSQMLVRNKSE